MSIHLIAGARPNFMKIAPLYHSLSRRSPFEVKIVHTGQHFDAAMSDYFFRDLAMPEPDVHFGVSTGSHGAQTAGILERYEALCLEQERPELTVVVGDVNSTLACALASAKLGIPVAHLEAGLRSRDRSMPEELNRLVTDQLADLLWTPSPEADENLRAEGIPPERIQRVGNIMIDSLLMLAPRIQARRAHADHGLSPRDYAVVTLHRPSNVDSDARFREIVAALLRLASEIPVVWPVHPRALKALERSGTAAEVRGHPGITLTEPMGYLDFVSLVHEARMALTDSGGLQEETSYLGIPCLTLRENTERPVTLSHGTNRLVSVEGLSAAMAEVLAGPARVATEIPLWDGHTADRIAEHLVEARRAGVF